MTTNNTKTILVKLVQLAALVASALSSGIAAARVPPRFAVQGVLRDEAGRLQSTPVDVTVNFYDSQAGGTVLAGPYGPTTTEAQNGLFTVTIGDARMKQAIGSATTVWMEITVGANVFSRQLVNADLYAIMAGSAEQADALSANCVGCVDDARIKNVDGGKVSGKVAAATHAETVTNGVYTTGAYADPEWITQISGGKITGKVAASAICDTVTNGVYVNQSYADPAWITSLAGAKIVGQVASAANADVAASVTNGVYTTGAYADPAWITALGGGKITGKVAAAAIADSFTGQLAGDVSGAQGSTSVTALAGVALPKAQPQDQQLLKYDAALQRLVYASDQNSGGTLTAVAAGAGLSGGTITTSGTIGIAAGGVVPGMVAAGLYGVDVTGNAGTVTNGVYTTGAYADPSWIASLAGSKIAGQVLDSVHADVATRFSGSLSGDVVGAQNMTQLVAMHGVSLPNRGPADRQLMKYDLASNSFTFADDQNSGGTVTSITAGAGLDGGSISSVGTIAISPSGIVPSMVAPGSFGIDITGNARTVTNGLYATATYADPAWITALAGTKITGQVASAAVADTVTNGVYTSSSYFDPSWIATLDGAKVTGKVAAAANADTVTHGVYTNGSYGNPAWLTSLDGAKVSGKVADAAHADDSASLGGLPAMQYQQVLQASCPSGQLLTGIDPNGAPHCASPRVEAGASSGKSLSIDPSGAVAHLVMNAPASGYAFVTATFDVSVDNANTDCSVASQIASAPGIPSSGPAFQDFNYPGSINTRSVGGTQLVSHGSITTAVAVNAGANSLYLNGFNDCNAADWSNVNITAVYFAAGAVSRLVVP